MNIQLEDNETAFSLYSRLKQPLFNVGIRIRTVTGNDGKILISLSTGGRPEVKKLCMTYGNGALIEADPVSKKQKVLCHPSPLCYKLSTKYPVDEKTYDCYPIIDGTVLNLYYYDETWKMGSKHSYDISDHYWRGIVYKEEINRQLENYTDFSWDKLDKDCTYSILMVCRKTNPVAEKDQLIFISRQTNGTPLVEYNPAIGKSIGLDIMPKYPHFIPPSKNPPGNGIIYRSKVPDMIDMINRSRSYLKLRSMIYNIPNRCPYERLSYIRRNFKYTDFMLLCIICTNRSRLLSQSVPSLAPDLKKMHEVIKCYMNKLLEYSKCWSPVDVPEYLVYVLEDLFEYMESNPGYIPTLQDLIESCCNLYNIEYFYKFYTIEYNDGKQGDEDKEKTSSQDQGVGPIQSKNHSC